MTLSSFTPGNHIRKSDAASQYIGVKTVHGIDNAIEKYVFDICVANGYVYAPDNIDAERLVQLSCHSGDKLEAKVDSKSHSIAHR